MEEFRLAFPQRTPLGRRLPAGAKVNVRRVWREEWRLNIFERRQIRVSATHEGETLPLFASDLSDPARLRRCFEIEVEHFDPRVGLNL